MKNANDFDVRQFAPEGSMSETTTTATVGGGARPSKRGVSSEQSEIIEETAPTLQNGEITPIPLSGQTAKPRQTVLTSVTEQSALSHQTASAQTTEPPQSTLAQPSRVSSRQRRASLDECREIFLPVPKIIDRQPVFVSRDVRDKIDGVVRRLGERKMSVSDFLENLVRHHFDLYTDDLEQWKRL